MRLRPGFLTHRLGEDCVLVPVGKQSEKLHGFVRLNDTAGFIVERLKKDTTREAILDALTAEYRVARDEAEADLDELLKTLRSFGALDE